MPTFNSNALDTPGTESSIDSINTPEDEQQYAPPPIRKSPSRQLINSPRRPSGSAFAYPVPKPISACLVDPFHTLPIAVDTTTNKLLHFYSQDSYWATAYALAPKIRPSIKGSWEYQAGACLSHFHILMARSALHQLRMNEKWGTDKARRELEYAALKHQTEAITVLRENVSRGQNADLKLILTSIISLATFEQRYGDHERAVLHFRTGRDIIRQIGMQDDGMNDRLREEQALWFEGIYRDPKASWMWGKEDANERLGWLKTLLKEVDRMWRDRQMLPLRDKAESLLPADSRLREFLFRGTTGRSVGVYGDIDEFVAQQRCILIFVCIMCAIYEEPGADDDGGGGGGCLKTVAKAMALNVTIRAYAAFLEDLLVEHALGPDQAVADLLWMMCQNYRDVKAHLVTAAPPRTLQRLDLKDCHWRASGIANVVKYLPGRRQSSLRNMLLDFIDGKAYTGKVRVNEFDFSYAGL
ncbi:hypothetical protein A1O7_02438 [Cladophialophora yegresii CBS 114405]|uniref:Uncharacterized protein n=1 Tax=Cladophialophora yegresii CBS 114405 TaxID=1182544 RepID=W9WBQ7_9EURO|nr:uncharacterized protein A1O7_02438 [Cladophialophora yegresii CBS 114405]EXJ62006.1 hypothetical protein A1O7_02438 [Cladophialophora yegresii CBS 114405]